MIDHLLDYLCVLRLLHTTSLCVCQQSVFDPHILSNFFNNMDKILKKIKSQNCIE